MQNKLLLAEDIVKTFSGVKVLDSVHLDINTGEIHALVGENGAGKSTLMKILTGVYQKDSGNIRLQDPDGDLKPVTINTPRQAQLLGISIVFQEFNLLDNLSIAENIYLGREPMRCQNSVIDWDKLYSDSRAVLNEVGLDLDVRLNVEQLSIAQKQMVEIAKCLSFKSKLIIMDEPTATLTDKETEILFRLLTNLRKKGVSIIYISHRMEEIFSITDRITVMRDGKYIDTLQTENTDKDTIIRLMVGNQLKKERKKILTKIDSSEVVLRVKNLSSKNTLKNISFDLHKGEILGFFGLVGAGRSELARAIFGIDKFDNGEIQISNKAVKIKNPRDAIKLGLGCVPEDRKQLGLVLGLSLKKNVALAKLQFLRSIFWWKDFEEQIANEYIKSLAISTRGSRQTVQELSGGNQQKVVIGKWLSVSPKILILDEPTRGIDVGAKAEIHNLMRELAEKGMSILMISSELPEILNVSDRVIVMHEGAVTLDASVSELVSERIMQAAVGEEEIINEH